VQITGLLFNKLPVDIANLLFLMRPNELWCGAHAQTLHCVITVRKTIRLIKVYTSISLFARISSYIYGMRRKTCNQTCSLSEATRLTIEIAIYCSLHI